MSDDADVVELNPEGDSPEEETPTGVFISMVTTEDGTLQPKISAVGEADVLQVLTILKLAVLKHEADLGVS